MRIGSSLWHSKRIVVENAEISKYDKPTEITTRANYITCMPMTSRGGLEVLSYGESATNYWTITANSKSFSGTFKKGDLMWVDGHKPITNIEQEYGYGASANAVVKSVNEVNLTISIILERNQKQVEVWE